MCNVTRLKIRWATWWPVPYWTERFNCLASATGIDLEVIFLSRASKLLPLSPDSDRWRFKYSIIRDEASGSGYSKLYLRIPKPWRLIQGDYDLLIMPYGDPDYVAAAMLSKLLNKPYCLFIPNNDFDQRPSSRIREGIKKYVCKNAVGALSTGPTQTDYASRYIKANNIRQIGNPAPGLNDLGPLRVAPGRSSIRETLGWAGSLVILYVGRFSPEKGLVTLLDAIKILMNQNILVHTVLVGAGPMGTFLKKISEKEHLNIEFTGVLEGVELSKRYLAADIFILPSDSEPWGLVVNEAMEAGLPVVVSDQVGTMDILVRHGENGFVFSSGDPISLASAFAVLISNKSLRYSMSKMSLQMIRSNSIDTWVTRVCESLGYFLTIQSN